MVMIKGALVYLLFILEVVSGDVCQTGNGPVVHACANGSAEGSVMFLDMSSSAGLEGSCTCSVNSFGEPVKVTLITQVFSKSCVIINIGVFKFLYTCKAYTPREYTATLNPGEENFISLIRTSPDNVADICLKFEHTATDVQFKLECEERGVFDVIDKSPFMPTPAPGQQQVTTTVGQDTTAVGQDTTDVGQDTTALGQDTTTEGKDTTTEGKDTTAEGKDTTAEGQDTTAEEQDTTATEQDTTAEEQDTTATEQDTTAEEQDTTATEQDTTAEEQDTTATEQDTTAEEKDTTATEQDTTAEEQDTTATEQDTTAEEQDTTATEQDTTAEEKDTTTAEQDTTSGQGTGASETKTTSSGSDNGGETQAIIQNKNNTDDSVPVSYIVVAVFAGVILVCMLLGTIWYVKDKFCRRRRRTSPARPQVEDSRL